jgi:putative membrane protein
MMYFGGKMMGAGGRLIGLGWELLLCLAFLVLVVLAIIALVRYIRVTGHNHSKIEMPGTNPALLILNERYAKGEITDEEYRAKKAEILKPQL